MEEDEPPAPPRPTTNGQARRIKSKVRPLRVCTRSSRDLTAEGRALVLSATATAAASGLRPSAAPLPLLLSAAAGRQPARQWRPDGAGDSALEGGAAPVAQTRATLALRVPVVPLFWRRQRRRQQQQQPQQRWRHEADVAVRLPPGLRLAATSRGLPDVRLELLDVLVSWGQREEEKHDCASRSGGGQAPAPPSPSCSLFSDGGGFGGRYYRIYPPARPSAAFAVRGGALLLAHSMFPDAAARASPLLALPAAAVDVAAPLALVLAPARMRRAARDLFGGGCGGGCGGGKDAAGDPAASSSSSSSLHAPQTPFTPPPPPPPLAVRLAAATAHAGLHALRGLSPPAAALASAAWLWRLLEPNSLLVLRGAAALAAVAADYNALRRDAALGRFGRQDGRDDDWDDADGGGGGSSSRGGLDAARRRVHRRAARRVAPFMRDLPDEGAAPLAPALAALGRVSVAAALAVGGVPLCGGGPGGSNPRPTAWLGWEPSSSPSLPLLHVSVVVDGASAPEARERAARRHAASGLDRGELLELFEGQRCGGEEQEEGGTRARIEATAAKSRGAVVVISARCAGASSCSSSSASSSSSAPFSPSWSGRQGGGGHGKDLGRREEEDGDGDDLDPLAFLDRLPLYGRPEAEEARQQQQQAPSPPGACDEDAAAIVAAGREGRLVLGGGPAAARARAEAELALRAARLLLAFLPFALLGLPLLAAAAALMERARERERQALGVSDDDEVEAEEEEDEQAAGGADDDAFWRDPARQRRAAAAWRRRQQERERRAAERRRQQQLMQRQQQEQQLLESESAHDQALARVLRAQLAALRVALAAIGALLELLLLLALGGDWMASASSSSGSGIGVGGGPFEAAALRLRRAAWALLVAGCARSGAAVIKCGQWAAVRRDLFDGDLCDALSRLHDAAPSHKSRDTRRALERAFGASSSGAGAPAWTRVFERFDWQPVASGSIAQVHRAVLRTRNGRVRWRRGSSSSNDRGDDDDDHDEGGSGGSGEEDDLGSGLVVAVKVRHPGVARHIAMDFLLLRRLASLAERAAGSRWLAGSGGARGARGPAAAGGGSSRRLPPLVHTLGQFSRTMAAQADLRVEAVHMLRFARDFGAQDMGWGRPSAAAAAAAAAAAVNPPPIAVPLPIAGMAAAEVLVETFEPGASVGRHLAAAIAERAALERRARARRLERRRRDRECAERQQQRQEAGEQEAGEGASGQQQDQPLPPQPAAPAAVRRGAQLAGAIRAVASRAAGLGRRAWRRVVRRRRPSTRGGSGSSSNCGSSRSQVVALFLEAWLHMLLDTGFMHQDLHPGNLLVRPRAALGLKDDIGGGDGSDVGVGGGPDQQQQQQQLVLLDFGLAEELPADARRHFVSFLNHVAAGSPAHATRHLLRWSSSPSPSPQPGEQQQQQRGAPSSSCCSSRASRRALLADMAELFAGGEGGGGGGGCDLSSERGIDLDAVLGRTLLLARRHGLSLDGSHALLCMGCCALVRCAAALDPEFNLLDAAAPALLCHALTGSRALLGGGGGGGAAGGLLV